MPQGYGYGNARLRAMRSRLLTEIDYNNLLAKVSIEELITALTETPYKNDIELALVRVDGVRCIFEAVRANLTHTLCKIRGFFEGEPQILIDLLLRRWDRHNLLTILRGQTQEVPPELIESAIVPVGQLDEVALRELARQPGRRAVIDLMTIWQLPYAKVLRQVRPRAGTVADLDQFELALNRFHYNSLQEALGQGKGNKGIVREYLQNEIDLINITVALRLAHRPDIIPVIFQRYNSPDVRPLFIEPGGHLPVQKLAELLAQGSGLEGMVRGLRDTRYGSALEAGWKRYQAGEGNLVVLERELERWQAKYAATMFTRDPLSIAIPIGYLSSKEVEVANLRLIAQAVALDMKREEMHRDLIIG